MNKKTLLVIPSLLLLSSCTSQGEAKLDSLLDVASSSSGKNLIKVASSKDAKATAKAMLEAKREVWKEDPLQLAKDLREAKRDYDRLIGALTGNVKKEWGKKEVKLPGSKTYVKYTKEYKSRAIVNFEQGEVIVETLEENAAASLKSAIVSTLLTTEDPASVDVFSDSAVKVGGKSPPFLLGLVLDDGKEIATPESAGSFADKIMPTAKTRRVDTENGKKPVRFVSFPMVANFDDKQAQKYLQHVRKYAKQYNISPSLVLGVIKSESAFNPHAQSHVPAYGLMQLVPKSGGLEAYRRAKGENKEPSSEYLLDPENNIELGAAYLNVLTYEQLDKVADRASRDYCVISAYNTGPSNVMRAFTNKKNGKQRFDEGFQRINSLSAAEVFQTLREKLPHEETRKYLPTVNNNRKLYYSVDKTVVAGDLPSGP